MVDYAHMAGLLAKDLADHLERQVVDQAQQHHVAVIFLEAPKLLLQQAVFGTGLHGGSATPAIADIGLHLSRRFNRLIRYRQGDEEFGLAVTVGNQVARRAIQERPEVRHFAAIRDIGPGLEKGLTGHVLRVFFGRKFERRKPIHGLHVAVIELGEGLWIPFGAETKQEILVNQWSHKQVDPTLRDLSANSFDEYGIRKISLFRLNDQGVKGSKSLPLFVHNSVDKYQVSELDGFMTSPLPNANPESSDPVRVSISEAARLFGIHARTIRRAISTGEIRYIVVRGRYKIHFGSLVSWSQQSAGVRRKRDEKGIGQWVDQWKIKNVKFSPREPGVKKETSR